MSNSEWEGEVHTIKVTKAEPPEVKLDFWHLEYEDIEHPPSCQKKGLGGYWDYDCDISWIIDNEGIEFALEYSGTPITEPGTYKIQGWGRETYHWEYSASEYDSGIVVVNGDSEAGSDE